MLSPRTAVLESFAAHRCSAILRTQDADAVRPALDAAVRGGFRIVEVTMNTPGCLAEISRLRNDPELIVGAGTVLTLEDAKHAMSAGAQFLVSPVTDAQIITFCRQHDLVSVPGTLTPTEMMEAHKSGADIIKLFPAPGNGPAFLRAVRGPLPFLRIYPTHGVTADNVTGWLDAGAFGVGFVGSLFEPSDLLHRRFDVIEQRARGMVAKEREHGAARTAATRPQPKVASTGG